MAAFSVRRYGYETVMVAALLSLGATLSLGRTSLGRTSPATHLDLAPTPASIDQSSDPTRPGFREGTAAAAEHAARLALFRREVSAFRALEARLWAPAAGGALQARWRTLRTSERASAMSVADWRTAVAQTDADCLAQAVYYEARSEPPEGQAAVAQVVLNRFHSPLYPKTVCGVVFQGAVRPGCQFSFACGGAMRQGVRDPAAWGRAQAVASQTLATQALTTQTLATQTLATQASATGGLAEAGSPPPLAASVGAALNYHADYVHPVWARRLSRVAAIGRHIFYQALAGVLPPGGEARSRQASDPWGATPTPGAGAGADG